MGKEISDLTSNQTRERSSKLIKELFSVSRDGEVVEFELDVVKGFGPIIGYLNKNRSYICAGQGLEKEHFIDLDNGEVDGSYIKNYRILS